MARTREKRTMLNALVIASVTLAASEAKVSEVLSRVNVRSLLLGGGGEGACVRG